MLRAFARHLPLNNTGDHMQVTYRLIDVGRVVSEQTKVMDGTPESNDVRIQSDICDGMDPLQLARAGKRAVWAEAHTMVMEMQ